MAVERRHAKMLLKFKQPAHYRLGHLLIIVIDYGWPSSTVAVLSSRKMRLGRLSGANFTLSRWNEDWSQLTLRGRRKKTTRVYIMSLKVKLFHFSFVLNQNGAKFWIAWKSGNSRFSKWRKVKILKRREFRNSKTIKRWELWNWKKDRKLKLNNSNL